MSAATIDKTDGMSDIARQASALRTEPLREPPAPAPAPVPAPSFVMPPVTNPVMKALLKVPILMWRLGLGRMLGRAVVLVTTTGRKSGLPRRTALGLSRLNGRKYVFTLRGPDTDWYRNMTANPHVTIQTADGSEPALARRVTGDEEIGQAYEFLSRMPAMKQWAIALGVELSREELIAHKDDFILIAFDPTGEPTPPPLSADLVWVWPLVGSVLSTGALLVRLALRRRPRERATG